MAIMVTSAVMRGGGRVGKFRTEASEVMHSLRAKVADLLGELGNFSRPADVQKALDLDKTLGRQVFKLACTAEAIGNGGTIPSRTSMQRFLEKAKERGVSGDLVEGVWSIYEIFEKLIETHAGDRVTFNSMISATSDTDDQWLVADNQHRRNAFRAMSHAMGIQAKTQLQLFVVNENDEESQFDIAAVAGLYGLRVLRQLPRIRVFGQSLGAAEGATLVYREPLGLSDGAEGHLLEAFCTHPLPDIQVSDGSNQYGQWREVTVEQPEVGKIGSSNLVFGTFYRGLPSRNQPLNLLNTSQKPTEVLLLDVLKKRSTHGSAEPTGKAILGYNEKFGAEIFPLKGKFKPEYLGKGPSSLATPEIPRYKDLLNVVAAKLKWEIDDFDAWRIRVEFPIHDSTTMMTWEDSKT